MLTNLNINYIMYFESLILIFIETETRLGKIFSMESYLQRQRSSNESSRTYSSGQCQHNTECDFVACRLVAAVFIFVHCIRSELFVSSDTWKHNITFALVAIYEYIVLHIYSFHKKIQITCHYICTLLFPTL